MGEREVAAAEDADHDADRAGPRVAAVCQSKRHSFSKQPQLYICLKAGLGVEGDAHQGATLRHRSRWRKEPHQPNLRQVHLLHAELFAELQDKGFQVCAGDLGENITTLHLDILALPTGTRLVFGDQAIVEVTGLRSPCVQMDRFRPGLMAAVLDRDEKDSLIRKAGIMSIVVQSGEVRTGDEIQILLPPLPHRALKVV